MSGFGPFELLRTRPIPDQAPLRALKADYRRHPLDPAGAAFAEPLAPIGDFGLAGANYYHFAPNPPYYRRIEGSVPFIAVRQGVGEKLAAVQERLAEAGLSLWLFDGWRPTALQAYFHEVWMPERLRALHPDWSEEAVREEATQYWAAPARDAASPSPHLTGGAVDLTLRWADSGQPLWMGSLFDDASAIAHLDRFEADPGAEAGLAFSDGEARANRRLLYWVMTEAGFCANPSEWWHFSHGDQMWARFLGHPAALYGAAALPEGLALDQGGAGA